MTFIISIMVGPLPHDDDDDDDDDDDNDDDFHHNHHFGLANATSSN